MPSPSRPSSCVHARFARDERGNVAMMFGLALLPLLGLAGATFDYTRASDARTRLQAAVDMAALAASRLPSATSQSTFETQVRNMVSASAGGSIDASSLTITPSRDTGKITVAAAATVPTSIMAILGFNSLSIAASSTVEWGNTRLRVALALDVTGSMGYDGKLPALQTAAKNLLKHLKTAAIADGDVYVSIVPFAKDVNVGASNYTASWVKWSGSPDTWDETNTTSGTCSNNAYSSQNSCTTQGYTWTPDHSKWNGCVMDREQN